MRERDCMGLWCGELLTPCMVRYSQLFIENLKSSRVQTDRLASMAVSMTGCKICKICLEPHAPSVDLVKIWSFAFKKEYELGGGLSGRVQVPLWDISSAAYLWSNQAALNARCDIAVFKGSSGFTLWLGHLTLTKGLIRPRWSDSYARSPSLGSRETF